jgi:hypothetical protein
MNSRKALGGVAFAAVTTLMVLAGAQTATAATVPPPPKVVTMVTPMVVKGYDATVAAANGFTIVTDSNGVQSSVPVTAAAKALVASSAPLAATSTSAGGVHPDGTGSANCGSSYITLTAHGLSYVEYETGYSVRLPTSGRWWGITVWSGAGATGVSMNSGLAGAKTWASLGYINGSGGGWGYVNAGSFAILTDGSVCYTTGPTDTW